MNDFDVPLLRLLARAVSKQRGERADTIVNGSAPDHAEYRYRAGFIAGLDAALDIARELDRQVGGEAPLEKR